MTILDQILMDYPEGIFYIAFGFDDAIIGFDESGRRLVYDMDEVINILVDDGMTHDEAVEYYDFKIANSFVGEGTPIFIKIYI